MPPPVAFRRERVLLDRPDVLVVDKPPGLVVHGGAAGDPDLVSRLGGLLADRGEASAELGVHQRLDKDASGVIAFSRSAAGRQRLAEAFESHTVERRYRAVVRGDLPSSGTLRDRIEVDREGRARIVQQGGKPAVAHFETVERVGERALLELSTETGRTHQLRVQLASRGVPIIGDGLYGGEPAPRLMLHATWLDFSSDGDGIGAPEPEGFWDWLRHGELSLGTGKRLARALADARCRRFGLEARCSVFRWADDAADDVPGVTVDRYGDFAVIGVRSDAAFERRQEVANLLVAAGARGVYLKVQPRGDRRRADPSVLAPREPIAGEAAEEPLEVREGPLTYLVRLGDGHSTGLFLDQRDNRERVRELARGGRVLNLFCYTGAFTVAAGVGGASSSVSVDLSRRYLSMVEANLVRNHLPVAAHARIAEDAIVWLRRARRKGERFDVVVLDPPTFGSRGKRGKKTFSVASDYGKLAEDALALLAAGGHLLAVTNHRATSGERLRKIVHEAARRAGRRVERMVDLGMPMDFPHRPGGHPPTKSVLVTVE